MKLSVTSSKPVADVLPISRYVEGGDHDVRISKTSIRIRLDILLGQDRWATQELKQHMQRSNNIKNGISPNDAESSAQDETVIHILLNWLRR
jgi:hypothetical protein